MPLSPGTRLGPYEVVSAIGAGGMGEVYRARDTRLKRDVALKILPESFAADPERRARFQREAEVLATLNHPHIAGIYGLEESGDVHALVMELVEGPTLADRIAQGAIPIDEALPIARQIAEALEAAHEQGVIHRDLKPANIKVRPDGTVKVLDFGLAKALEPTGSSTTVSQSPTITSPAMTAMGVILGTAAYMSPEQARGKLVDKRADIWAFGCVFYEMLAGKRAFQADGVADTLAAIVRGEPEWGALPASLPSNVCRLVTRCLDKDARRRLRDIGEARVEIENAITGGVEVASTAPLEPSNWRRRLMFHLGLVLLTGLVVGSGVWVAMRPVSPQVTRLSIVPPADAPLSGANLAVSPDGRRIVYVSGNGTQLSVRAIDELAPNHIANLGSPSQPFVSPDGQWIGFFDGLNALKKVPITGGPAVFVASLGGAAPRGASWSSDGTIIFATDDPATGLWRVSEDGGAPVLLTKREQGDHSWPHVLPGSQAVLFTQFAFPSEAPEVAVLDLASGVQRVLMPGSHAQYAATGHLVYGASGTLRAIGFDIGQREVVGISVPVLDQVSTAVGGTSGVVVATSGTLAYVSGLQSAARQLVWVDRQGKEELLAAPTAAYVIPRLSPDGKKVAVDDRDISGDGLSMWDIERKTMTRFTFGVDAYPVWTPDGQRVAFTSFDAKTGVGNLFWQRVGGAVPERLSEAPRSRYASSFTPDGARLLFREEAGPAGLDIGMLTMGREHRSDPLIQTEFSELNPEISPDGRWLAYESNRSGPAEIYVRPFPDVNAGLRQISTGGGVQPAWARNGRELFYRTPDDVLMAVPVELNPSFTAAAATKILEGRYYRGRPFRSYDIAPDSKRFLMITRGDAPGNTASAASIVVVQNWHEELKRLVPTN